MRTISAADPQLRWLIRRDLDQVMEIEQASFEFPWTEEEFRSMLCQKNCIGVVAEHGGDIVGYMVYELHPSNLRLLSMCVCLSYRRTGVGRQMLERLIGKLSEQRARRAINVTVRETNLTAQVFFRSLGFRATRVLRDEYEEVDEDAYLMQFRLAAEPSRRLA